MELWIGLLIGIVVGAAVAAFITRAVMQPRVADTIAAAESEIAEKRLAAEREAENILRTSREAAQDIRLEAEKAIERRYRTWHAPRNVSTVAGPIRTHRQKPSNNANNCSISARADWTSARTIWATWNRSTAKSWKRPRL